MNIALWHHGLDINNDRGKESQLQCVICLKGHVCIDVGLNRIQPLRKPIDPYMLRGQQ